MTDKKIREFDASDWDAFGGAEEFTDGSQPLICEMDHCAVVGSLEGIDLFFPSSNSDKGGETDAELIYSFPSRMSTTRLTVQMARLIMEGLPSDLDPLQAERLGFERIQAGDSIQCTV